MTNNQKKTQKTGIFAVSLVPNRLYDWVWRRRKTLMRYTAARAEAGY